jgi:hypothetical protein
MTLLLPFELDRVLRYPQGKSERLARQGKLPHIRLPDGSIRFEVNQISKRIRAGKKQSKVGVAGV